MSTAVTFSLDLEDHRADRRLRAPYPANTHKILDLLDEWQIRGTFFVVGEIAEATPVLVRDIAERGHEVAFHSYSHRPLTLETHNRFREETTRGRALLQELTGQAIGGYRAPIFSLVPESNWVVEILSELGFDYSSSVLPLHNPLHGYPGLPRTPFRWPSGLLEIPVPVAKLGPLRFPYLGGFYLRYLPRFLVAKLRARAAPAERPWIYCHPYDFDTEEAFARMRDASLVVSVLLWFNRANTVGKIAAVLRSGAEPPFAEQIARGDFANVPSLRAPT